MSFHFTQRLLFLFCLFFLSGCSAPRSAEPTIDATQFFHNALETATWSVPTWTPAPSHTPFPPTSTPTLNLSPTVVCSSTPLVLSNFHLVGVGFVNDGLMFSISVPGITGQYYALVNNKRFNCFMQPGAAEMLYCTGAMLPAGTDAAVSVFRNENSQQAVMTLALNVPQNPNEIKTATPKPNMPTNSPAPTEEVCTQWCSVNEHYDGFVMKECRFTNKADAEARALDIDRGCPAVSTGPAKGSNMCVSYSAECAK
jgi:hypothetical protein